MAKRTFTLNNVEYAVISPSVEQKRNSDIHKSVTFAKMAQAGVIFRDSLFKLLRENGVWNDEKEKTQETLKTLIRENLSKLEEGKLSREEIQSLVDSTKAARMALNILLQDYFKHDEFTVEGISEQAKFQFLVSQCTVYNEDLKKKVFSSLEDYLDKEDSDLGEVAAAEFARLYHKYDEAESALPENKYILKTEDEPKEGT